MSNRTGQFTTLTFILAMVAVVAAVSLIAQATNPINASQQQREGAELHGTKFHDLNANGVRDMGEPGLQGFVISLSGGAVQNDITSPTGEYEFIELGGAIYRICETIAGEQQNQQSAPMAGVNCPNGTTGHQVNLAPGEVVEDLDFGNYQFGEIHGRKLVRNPEGGAGCGEPNQNQDEDENENDNGNESDGCSGVVIVLTGIDGMGNPVERETETDGQGGYWFTELKPGNYTISVVEPEGYVCDNPSPCQHDVELTSGEFAREINFVDIPDDGGGGRQREAEEELYINEIMWSGTGASPDDQWIELLNLSDIDIGLDNWILQFSYEENGERVELNIELEGEISSRDGEDNGFFLLERGDDDVVRDITANQIFDGALPTTGAIVRLFNPEGDVVDTANIDDGPWPAGQDQPTPISMERVQPPIKPEGDEHWHDNDGMMRNGLDRNEAPIDGTPKADNSPGPM